MDLTNTHLDQSGRHITQAPIRLRFFEDRRSSSPKCLVITDNLLRLKESLQYGNLPREVESRWRLVETAWSVGLSTHLLEVHYDPVEQMIISPHIRRVAITSSRDALNGYQKGKCFYCFGDISINPDSPSIAEVDHFFPHVLKKLSPEFNLDGVWNLVLSCKRCNGPGEKWARVPELRYLERLHKRNSFLIASHHPLRDTLIIQTGDTEEKRRAFLTELDSWAINHPIHRWKAPEENEPWF